MATGASSFVAETDDRTTIIGAEIYTISTQDVPSDDLVGSGKPNNLYVGSSTLCASGLLHLPPCSSNFLCIREMSCSFCLVWGKWKVNVRVKCE